MTKLEKIDTLVIDTGVLVEFFRNSEIGNKFHSKILTLNSLKYFYLNPITYTELLYIFCRELGMEKSQNILAEKLKHFLILEEEVLRAEAAKIKCKFGIALADCYSIAAANLKNCPVLMKKELEIAKIDMNELGVKIFFIDDI